jgi:murein DD-endopeptidase MepM/ murein hydrolase activator NlpD
VGKNFSVILVPQGGSRVRRWTLSSRFFYGIAATWVLVTAIAVLFVCAYFQERVDHQELLSLRQENTQQRQELQRVAGSLDGLTSELTSLAASEARIRQLSSFDAEPEELPVAIGGLPPEELVVDDLQQRIDGLHDALELRRQRQEMVHNLLNDQVSISRATPKGWPMHGWLTSYFGMRTSPITGRRVIHEGIDIAANIGTPIYATADGVVSSVVYSPSYGKLVKIDHGYGYRSIFAHTSQILVKPGQRVERGDLIAKVGNTGRSTGPHLHYELRLDGVPIDPRKTL